MFSTNVFSFFAKEFGSVCVKLDYRLDYANGHYTERRDLQVRLQVRLYKWQLYSNDLCTVVTSFGCIN